MMKRAEQNYPDVYSCSFESENGRRTEKELFSLPQLGREMENEGEECNQQQLFFISHSRFQLEMENNNRRRRNNGDSGSIVLIVCHTNCISLMMSSS
jgi:hypothetical protein